MTKQTKTADRTSTVGQLLAEMQPAFARVLPQHLKPEQFMRVALTSVRKNPRLAACDPVSLMAAVMDAAQCGLLIDGILGQGHLVPFKREAVFVPGYRGLIDLAVRSGVVRNMEPRVFYAGDTFSYQYGTDPRIEHKPCEPSQRSEMLGTYAVAFLMEGGSQFDVMHMEELLAIRNRSAGWKAKGQDSPWGTDFEAMALKTPIRRVSKYLPRGSDQMRRAITLDEMADARTPEFAVRDSVVMARDAMRDAGLEGEIEQSDRAKAEAKAEAKNDPQQGEPDEAQPDAQQDTREPVHNDGDMRGEGDKRERYIADLQRWVPDPEAAQ